MACFYCPVMPEDWLIQGDPVAPNLSATIICWSLFASNDCEFPVWFAILMFALVRGGAF
jgi:hypothetical protein